MSVIIGYDLDKQNCTYCLPCGLCRLMEKPCPYANTQSYEPTCASSTTVWAENNRADGKGATTWDRNTK